MRKLTATATLLLTATASVALAQLHPVDLRTEYKDNPLGIGEVLPRLSWRLESPAPLVRNKKQSAYRLIASPDPDALRNHTGILWDTGKVASDQTTQIEYAGRPLGAGQHVYWSVQSWDENGTPGEWSSIAHFSIGLLAPEDWRAEWIGYDVQDTAPAAAAINLDGAAWVWHDEGDPTRDAPAGGRYFRGSFEIPAERRVKSATLAMSADDNFEAFINNTRAGRGDGHNRIHTLDLTNNLRPGRNTLAVLARNGGGPAALAGRVRVQFDDGSPDLVFDVDASFKSAPNAPKGWQAPDFDDSAWTPVKVLAPVGAPPWGMPEYSAPQPMGPAAYLRSEFTVAGPLKRATAYATALGVYELRLNGARVGDVQLAPGWTDFNKRVYFNTYDVKDQLKVGHNAVGIALGDGWYAGYLGYTGKRRNYGGDPRALLQIELEYTDGSRQYVTTNRDWRAQHGPLRQTDLLMGETYDARQTLGAWDDRDFKNAPYWHPVNVGLTHQHPATPATATQPAKKPADIPARPVIQAHPGSPVTRQEEIATKAITEPKPGVYVIDLGQNMVGWVRLSGARGRKGEPITLRHAEMLNDDGTLYTIALRAAKATDTYIPADDKPFSWEPQFTFHGFRYVELTGLSAPPDESTVTGIVVHSDMDRTGFFECSNPLVNQLFHNIIWGQKGNYLEVPTDCPQRDERLGWTGDAQVFIRTGSYNFNTAPFFTKWLVDLIDDSQMTNGAFTHVAPALAYTDGGGTGWQDAAPICTWTLWTQYNDTRIIRRHWPALVRYMQYLHDTSKDLVRNEKPFGDWLNLGGSAKGEVIGTAYYAYVANLMSQMAAAIGRDPQAAEYADLRDAIIEKFRSEFLNSDGSIKESSQTGYALALTSGLIPDDLRTAAGEKLVADIQQRNDHLATGFLGTPRLLPALTNAGRTDVAYRLLFQDTFPSWLYQVKLGATTMWERWDGYTPDKGFQTPGMNSFNHYAFGSVGQWLYQTVAGINYAAPGYKKIVIAPHLTPDLTYARGVYDSIHGRIFAEWRQEGADVTALPTTQPVPPATTAPRATTRQQGGTYHLSVTIPPNTTAEIRIPTANASTVQEGGRPIAEVTEIRPVNNDANLPVYTVGSGSYEFTFTP